MAWFYIPAQRRPSSPKTKCWSAWIHRQAPARPIVCCCGFDCWHCCWRHVVEWNFVARRHPKPPIRSDWACRLAGYPGDSDRHRPSTNGRCSTFGAAPSAKTLYPVRIQKTSPNRRRKFAFERVRATLAVSFELRFSACWTHTRKKKSKWTVSIFVIIDFDVLNREN